MKLSVIVLNYNQTQATLRCLESLKHSLAEIEDSEILLIDNGSNDKIPPENLDDYTNLQYYQLTANIGVARGRNYGLRKATGEYILILDNDTIVNKEAIESLLSYIQKSVKTGIVAPVLLNIDDTVQSSFRDYPGIKEKLRNIFLKASPRKPDLDSDVIHPCYVIGACQMFRKGLVSEIGLLDDNIFYGPEDADFCLRASQAGYTIDCLPTVTIFHDHRRITKRRPISKMAFRHVKALLYFYRKHHRWFA